MGLSTAAIITLSTGVTKALIKLWLDDRALLIAAGQSATDLLGLKIKDALQRKRIKRQLEQIGEDVAESIGQLFEAEGIRVGEGGQRAVTAEVHAALDDPLLSPRGMAESDLDDDRVAQALLAAHAHRKALLSEAESAMFDRMLLEAAQRTLRIVQVLPNFQVAALGTILRRQTETMAAVEKVLADLRRMRETAARMSPDRKAAVFEERYRAAIERKLNRVELFGMRTGTRKYPLTVAFVTLEAERAAEGGDGIADGAVHEVIGGEGHRLWITGLAGAGKTTLLQWLAVQTARDELPDALSDWRTCVPFFIRLRKFPSGDFPPPSRWVEAAVPALAGVAPHGWADRLLQEDRAVVLIDGIDEVPEERRGPFREWVEDLMDVYPEVIWVFSSRPLMDGGIELSEVREIALRSMGSLQIKAFIEHWHKAVAEESEDDGTELAQLADELQERLRERPNLRRLITSPLLCAMVCALHRDRRALLPDGRRGLYEACTEMLLDLRDRQRDVSHGLTSPLTFPQKRALLADLAYYMLRNGLSMLPFDQMDAQFARTLPRLTLPEGFAETELRRFMTERSGLLRMPEPGLVDFVHKSFMEFLAAGALLAAGDVPLLIQHATESGWREVFLHAASQARGVVEAGGLIEDLLARAEEDESARHQLVLLALAAVGEVQQLEPPIRARVADAVEDLGRPTKVSDAEYWSAAGELVVPVIRRFLSERPNSHVARACIRVLGQVGSPAAVDLLSDAFADDDRQIVRQSLVHSLQDLEVDVADGYVRRLLHGWLYRVKDGRAEVNLRVFTNGVGDGVIAALAPPLARCLSEMGPFGELSIRGHLHGERLVFSLLRHLPGLAAIAAPHGWLRWATPYAWEGLRQLDQLTLWPNRRLLRSRTTRGEYFAGQLRALAEQNVRLRLDPTLWEDLEQYGQVMRSQVELVDTTGYWSDPWWVA